MSTSPQPARDDPAGAPSAERSGTRADPDGAGSHAVGRAGSQPGLSEERSAGILTGDTAAYQSDPYTTITPGDAGGPASTAAAGSAGDDARRRHPSPRPDADGGDRGDRDDETAVLLEGATQARPRSRTRSHVWGVVLSALLVPVAWYLLADAGARLTLPPGNPWETGTLNVAAIAELGAGLLVLAVVLLAAMRSSIGAIVTGVLLLVLGVPFVAAPEWTQSVLEPLADRLQAMGSLGSNVAHHLEATGSTGRFVVYGLALVLLGVVSHGARRQGRREGAASTQRR